MIFLGLGSCYECKQYFKAWEQLCELLCIPLAAEKTVGQSQNIVFLGIELCSVDMLAQFSTDKITKYIEKLSEAMNSRTTTLHNMQSLIGCL